MTRMVRAKRPSTTSCDRALTTPQYIFHWEIGPSGATARTPSCATMAASVARSQETRVQTVCHLR